MWMWEWRKIWHGVLVLDAISETGRVERQTEWCVIFGDVRRSVSVVYVERIDEWILI